MPATLDADVTTGAIVRVPLQRRRVRGWVVAEDVAPEADPAELREVLGIVSAGPPPEVVALCEWGGWRWGGTAVGLLRAASPPNVVSSRDRPEPETGIYPPADAPVELAAVPGAAVAARELVVTWPPLTPRRDLVAWRLAEEGSTLVLAPDGLTVVEVAADLEARGRDVVVLRSEQSDAERTRAWAAARAGACVVVGGRIAALAPVPDVASVIVLDEGDEALREERAPTWSGRDVAIERARRAGASVTLVSPAPTVDAVAMVDELARPRRIDERAGWPRVEVLDRRDDPPGRGWFSDRLVEALRAVTPPARGVCVVNRKGRARLLECLSCGSPAACELCGAAVGETDDGAPSPRALALVCPQCATARPSVCLVCTGTRFRRRRVGVRHLRDELAALLPRLDVADVEGDSTGAVTGDVIIGTEAVLHRARGSDRPVHLAAFLDFDQELLAARYRASEQALWLLVRAARLLATREPGRVIVQTRTPEHEVLRAAREGDPTVNRLADAGRRRLLGFPPFGGVAELSGAVAAVELAVRAMPEPVTVLGPTPTAGGARALVKAPSVAALSDAIAAADLAPARAAGRLRVDVDPLRI